MIYMIILKIGGSILTNKDAAESEIDEKNLSRIAKEIKSSLDNDSKEIIIVHGAGSFGHPPAKEYKIGEPFDKDEYPQKRIGFSKTQNAVKRLNMLICDEFIKEDLPVVAVPASSFMVATNKRITEGDLDSFKRYLNKGFIPVIYGDVVLDNDLEILPVINKVDLPNARPDEVKAEIEDIIGIPAQDAPCISAKSGLNVEEVLEKIVTDLPAPKGDENAKAKCLIFDSYYDKVTGRLCGGRN